MDNGLFPYSKRYLGTLRNHFSTLGVNGINEMIRNFTSDRENITTEWGHDFAMRLLTHVRARIITYQEQTGHMYNLEATPAEGTTYRFAKEDQARFPDIIQAGTPDMPYYTNSSQLPVGFTDDPFEALERQEPLQRLYTGGTVLHLYMTERISTAEACAALVRRALERFSLPYITVTPTFSICPRHGYLAGEHEFCPLCDQEILARKTAVPVPRLTLRRKNEWLDMKMLMSSAKSSCVRRNANAARSGRVSWAITGPWPRSTSANRENIGNAGSSARNGCRL